MQTEEENINSLLQMMGGDLDAGLARRTLLKHNGDIQNAAAEILDLQAAQNKAPTDKFPSVEEDSWNMNIDLDAHVPVYTPQRPNTPRSVERQYD